MLENLRMVFAFDPGWGEYAVWIKGVAEDRIPAVVRPLIEQNFAPLEPGRLVEPSLQLNRVAVQALFDQMWGAGFRPTDGDATEGVPAAMREHIKDLRWVLGQALSMKSVCLAGPSNG